VVLPLNNIYKGKKMKRIMVSVLVFTFIIGSVFAQETLPAGQTVKLGTGELTINGRFLLGFNMTKTDQEGTDGKITIGALHPEHFRNQVQLGFGYAFQNFGATAIIESDSRQRNQFGSPALRYGLVYGNFLDDKLKVSLGKMYAFNNWERASRIWETQSYSEKIRFVDEDRFSMKFEIKPISGLNVGFQYFFVDDAANKDFGRYGAWKEFGIGADYIGKGYNIQAGVRLDSKIDPMDGTEARGYLTDYYGRGVGMYKDAPADDFEGGTYIFAGFRLTGLGQILVDGHGALYNLGDFGNYGYGRFAERFQYSNFIPKWTFLLSLSQEFYGHDNFQDGIKSAPFIQFIPEISYTLLPNLDLQLEGIYGIAPDVLDSYWRIKPQLKYEIRGATPKFLNSVVCKLFYHVTETDYKSATGIPKKIDHFFGLGAEIYF
jgi:hypothetical protein